MNDPVSAVSPGQSGIGDAGGNVKLELLSTEGRSVDPADAAQFRAALERHMQSGDGMAVQGAGGKDTSLGHQMTQRATTLAAEVNKDQQYVSKLLEQATRTGDSMQLMKAMMALNDYQLRVQTISKTVSKAASSIETLTKLQ